ncbi:MAG: preprotein translocase subunit YajC [Clostridia bacterium]|nr:preprotein translocase subunit YajC [Clostridia bacterium]
MFFNLLTSAESVLQSGAKGNGGKDFPWFLVGLGVLLVAMIIMNSVSNKKRREQIEEEKKKRGAIEAGFKVTTIGGIMGTVVEVDHEANTFVLQTGTLEQPCYIKFDKVAIYSSEDPNAPVETLEEEVFDDDVVDATVANESPVDETTVIEEETPATEDAE